MQLLFFNNKYIQQLFMISGTVLALGDCSSVQAEVLQPERPNVILILSDDQGYGDVGFHGNANLNTPHLDQMAAKGVELSRFYCSPVCAPTRASLMTGRYYYRTGVIHTSRGGAKMHGDEVTIAELLKDAGYKTGIFGKWHLGDNFPMRPQDQGFEESLVHKSGGIGQSPDKPNSYFNSWLWKKGTQQKAVGYCTDVFFKAAIDFIDREKTGSKPFFVYLPTNAPHTPLEVSPSYWRPYQKAGLNETTAKVYGMISNLDDNVGKLMSYLKRSHLLDTTIVLFIGDNGPQQKRYNSGLRGRKSSTYEGGIRVPFLAQWPGRFQEGTKSDQIAAHIDILPTLLALTKTPLPETLKLDGIDLSSVLLNKSKALPKRSLFFQVHRGLTPQQFQNSAVVTNRYKLVGYPETFGNENLMRISEPTLELYDILTDPGEKNNLIQTKTEMVQKLRKQYESWFLSMKKSRNFEPGLIVVNQEKESPCILCRYQDGNYFQGRSQGWMVKITHSGLYKIQIDKGQVQKSGKLIVNWQGRQTHEYLKQSESMANFELSEGTGLLDIWFQEEGEDRSHPTENGTVGDVILKRLD